MLVPWNTSWSSENRVEIRPCRWAGGKLATWSPYSPGRGSPIFAKPHPVRQRRSIAELRCTVCGEKVGDNPAERYWFGIGVTEVASFAFATTEAPVHEACAHLALKNCPRLKALGAEPEIMPQWDGVVGSIVGGDQFEQDFGIKTHGRTVVGHLKLAWRCMPPLPCRKKL